jgi:nucleotide-binding universal stress UspA family protein
MIASAVRERRPATARRAVMSDFKKIVCAVDASGHSRAALDSAVELAGRLGADLTILHVFAPCTPGGDVMFPTLVPLDPLSDEPCRALLETWREEAEAALGRRVALELLTGNATHEIAGYSRRGVDVLVVGTRGPTGLGRLLLGSVAERVVRDAGCPVLVVHHPDAPTEAQASAG